MTRAKPTSPGPLFDDKTRLEELRGETIRFHQDNPEVWMMFERFAFELIDAGRKYFGVGAIWERMRWETAVNPSYKDKGFKLNNNYRAFYARAFERKYPQHEGFFRKRTQTSASKTART